MRSLRCLGTLLTVISVATSALAADENTKKITFDEHIVPIFREHCFSCHNQDKSSAGLVLNNYTQLMEGGSSGTVVEPGDPDSSRIWEVVDHITQPYMPPKSPKLAKVKLDTIRTWIEQGVLENVGSKSKATNKPKVDFSLNGAALGKPDGPPPMPENLLLEPVVTTDKGNAITALAASPWAPLVAVGGQKQVILYNSDTLEFLGILPFPEGVPQVLKFSRNGSLLLAGGGVGGKSGRVVVWSVTSGERLFEIGDELDSVLAADISSDQSKIALGGPSKVVRIYSTKDGMLLHELKKHTDWINSLEFSPDSVLLASGDRNGGLFVWEVHSAQEYLSLKGHSAAITDVSWRIDSNVLASASEDTTIRLWEMENGGQIKSWGAHGAGVQDVRFAKDGGIASVGRDRTPKLWAQDGKLQRAFEAFPDLALRVAVTHDNSRIIAGCWTGELRVWIAADGTRQGNLLVNPPPVAERLKLAQQALARIKISLDKITPVAAASKAAADKANADLMSAERAAAEAAYTTKVLSDAGAIAQTGADKLAAALKIAEESIPAREATAQLLAMSATKAEAAAKQMASDQSLAEYAAQGRKLADKATADLAAARKEVGDLAATAKTAGAHASLAQRAARKAAKDSTTAAQPLEALRAAAKAASEKAAADQKAHAQAAKALAAAEAAVNKWAAALTEIDSRIAHN